MNKTLIGILFMTGATLFYGTSNTLLKKAGFSPIATIAVQVFFLLITVLPFFLATESLSKMFENKNGFILLVLLGVGNAIGYYCVVRAFDYLSQSQISLFGLFSPLLASIAAYYILGEAVSAKLFVGLAVMAVGMIIAFR